MPPALNYRLIEASRGMKAAGLTLCPRGFVAVVPDPLLQEEGVKAHHPGQRWANGPCEC